MRNKRVLIFGGSGSLGYALINRLVASNSITICSRDEAKHWTIRNQIQSENLHFAIGDVRDAARVSDIIVKSRPNVIIVAAALKQVDTCERYPFESIQTNIVGVKNVTDAVESNLPRISGELDCVLLVSTDKACLPVNVYGMCKAVSERVVTSHSAENSEVRFIGVRYGNVLNSRGSILPLFRYQASHASAFSLTHKEMTRFVITLDESIDLILTAIRDAQNGEIWIPKLHAMRILDLVQIFSERYDKPIEVTGMRPGEKLHESLVSEPESVRVRDTGKHYVLKPSYLPVDMDAKIFEYNSAGFVFEKPELERYLVSIGLLDMSIDEFPGLRIEEIRMV